jgi:hypothetical protein
MAEMLSDSEDGVAWALKTTKKGKYICKADDAKEIQQQYDSLKAEATRLGAVQSDSEAEVEALIKQIEETNNTTALLDGPLMMQVKGILDDLQLERQVFHSGEFNGPDLQKMLQAATIEGFVSVLAPQRIIAEDTSADGEDCLIGLHLPPCTIGGDALSQSSGPCSTSSVG